MDSTNLAHAQFKLLNTGGLPIRVLSVESSCECATPDVRPTEIPPGKVTIVAVEAAPAPVGEQTVVITLNTDSTVTPEVQLRLRMTSSRRPPFLLSVGGDLTYRGGDSSEEGREIFAITIEPTARSRASAPETDLPFLGIRPGAVTESRYRETGTVQRTYHYQVDFTTDPPPGSFGGVLTIADPWDPAHVERLNIRGHIPDPVEVLPSRLVLRVREGEESAAEATFVVRLERAGSGPQGRADRRRGWSVARP